MKRALTGLFSVALLASLAACGETPQTAGGKKPDTKASAGAVDNKYTAAGWSKGDQTAWENQLKTRTQQGQNEYSRVIPSATTAASAAK